MKIGLPFSQHFHIVREKLLPIAGAVVFRKEEHLDEKLENVDRLFHTNGFIDNEFDRLINNHNFLSKIKAGLSLLSFDLGPSCIEADILKEGYQAVSRVLKPEEILKIADKKLANIRRYYQGCTSVENLDFHQTGAYDTVCDPDFISDFVAECKVGLTLDIGHLEVTCANLSMNEKDYLCKLPLSKIKEIHITHSPGSLDVHMLPGEKEYRLLELILERSNPDYIIIEYYQEPKGIIDANIKLMEFMSKAGIYEN